MTERITCTNCKTISPIPAYVVAQQFGTFCLQCWELGGKLSYYEWLSGITPSYGAFDEENK